MNQRILIVDDAPFMREVLRHLVEEIGGKVIGEAENGKIAVDKAKQLNPDVILMDLVMPELSGIEAAKEILEFAPDTKIIACTTLDQEAIVVDALGAGFCNYVTKPFEKENLIKILKSCF